jgi:hypothetical protein
VTDVLKIAREKRARLADLAERMDEFILYLECFLASADRVNDQLVELIDHPDEFIIYAEFLLQNSRRNLQQMLDKAEQLDQFITFAEDLLSEAAPEAAPAAVPLAHHQRQRRPEEVLSTDTGKAWLDYVVRRNHSGVTVN